MLHEAVIHGVPMDIIHMRRVDAPVADRVSARAALPDAAFAGAQVERAERVGQVSRRGEKAGGLYPLQGFPDRLTV